MGFSGTIRRLKDALRRLRDVLELPWVVENPDEEAKDWREEATELCYDLEDAIAKYSSSSVTGSPSADKQAQAALDQLRRRAMDALSEFNNKLSLRETSNCVDQIEDEADDASSFPVGMKDPTEKIIELLNLPHQGDHKAHKVVSIVGLAGSGKTTLAAQVYQNIADKFQCKARVFVTRKPNVKGILINLLQKLGGNGDSLDDLHELTLVRLIQDHVQHKRFLVLAEDICDENTWMVIRCALSHNNDSGGRIIMTTRKNYIASLGDSVYRIYPLSKENSKSLLLKNVHLMTLSDDSLDKILEKCGGLPLALIAMSDVLKKVECANNWEKLYNSMNNADTEDSIKNMRRKLSLGYYELSYHLRMCLLYLSIFPTRHEIKRKRLVHRWIAQGLVDAQYGENVAEKATCYFNELIDRNWIEPVNIKSDGQARACRVHNVILDFIVYKSAEENFVTLLGSSSENKKKKKIHNLSIKNRQDSTKLGEVSHVRSLTIFGKHIKRLPCPLESDVLHVLDLEDYYPDPYFGLTRDGIKSIVDASSLLHLRYLSVRAACINNGLPDEVAKMRQLETLELRQRRVGEVLQLDITRLQQLVRLLVDSDTILKAEIKNMKALEEVKYISVSKHSEGLLKELGQLANLRVLGIHLDAEETPYEQKKTMALASSLHKLGNSELHSLYIDGSWEISLNLSTSDGDSRQLTLPSLQKLKFRKWCYLNEVPGWITSLQNLGELRLGISKMKQDQLAILGALPCLVDLFLDILEVHGEEIMFEELTGFRYLKCLGVSCRTRMKVTFGEKSVPCLVHLKLHVDVREVVMPEGCKFVVGIQHLSSLTKFDGLIYCVRETDPVVKHVKDAMQKEAGGSITAEFTEKEEIRRDERMMMDTIGDMLVRNPAKVQFQKLESTQIDIKKLPCLLEDTRRFLMMLLDDENPKHQVVEWRNTVQDLFLSTYRVMRSLYYSGDFSSSRLQTLRLNIEKMESLPPKKSSGLSSGSKATDKWTSELYFPYRYRPSVKTTTIKETKDAKGRGSGDPKGKASYY